MTWEPTPTALWIPARRWYVARMPVAFWAHLWGRGVAWTGYHADLTPVKDKDSDDIVWIRCMGYPPKGWFDDMPEGWEEA